MTFKDLPVGAAFRVARDTRRQVEWTKIEPIYFDAGHVQYNATSARGRHKFGHSTKVLVSPYDVQSGADKQKRRYQQLKERVMAAGWQSIAEMETAMIHDVVAVPRKPK